MKRERTVYEYFDRHNPVGKDILTAMDAVQTALSEKAAVDEKRYKMFKKGLDMLHERVKILEAEVSVLGFDVHGVGEDGNA